MPIEEAMQEFMGKEFSPECTDEEAILFIRKCPNAKWVNPMLAGYAILRLAGLTPYKSLWGAVQSYLEVEMETK